MNEKDYEYVVSAAGRVNIIGEHIDYCGGKVMPAALSLKNTVYVRSNGTDRINIEWSTTPDKVSLDINALESYRDFKYGSYQAGCAFEWKKAGHKIVGCDMYQNCTVPFGSGLSSSAAIEVSTIAAFAVIAGEKVDSGQIAIIAQQAEHNYAGVNCGIMDQYASACGKKNMAMLLDCKTLDCEYIPFGLGEYALVIADCNKPHRLIESKYNERRAETQTAFEILKTKLDIDCLADVSLAQFSRYAFMLPQPVRKRAEHVVNECQRVKLAEQALRVGNIEFLGKLLNLSHASLRDLYETTGKEADALVAAAQSHPSCVGSRLTGGGFGGSTISIVKRDDMNDFCEYVYRNYYNETGYQAKFYNTKISDGLTVQKI